MTRFDLHPEDLLERAQRGTANTDELQRLEQHFAECVVCRVERGLSRQAALDAAPLRDEQLRLLRLKRDVGERLSALRGRRAQKRGTLVGVVLVAASLASVAAAATLVIVKRTPAGKEASLVAPVDATGSAGKVRRHAAQPQAAQEGVLPQAPAPAIVLEAPAEVVARPQAGEASTPAELFSRANQARRAGDVKEAAGLYQALQVRYSGSSEELVSRVAFGRLLLDRLGDSRGALVQFNRYLASPGNGPLREEAMVGRALALGRLGSAQEERAAWTALLASWPKSMHARRAKARLLELESASSSGAR